MGAWLRGLRSDPALNASGRGLTVGSGFYLVGFCWYHLVLCWKMSRFQKRSTSRRARPSKVAISGVEVREKATRTEAADADEVTGTIGRSTVLIGALIAAACNVHLPTKVPAYSLPRRLGTLRYPSRYGEVLGCCNNLSDRQELESDLKNAHTVPAYPGTHHYIQPGPSSIVGRPQTPQTTPLTCCGTTPSDLKCLVADPDSSSQLNFTVPLRYTQSRPRWTVHFKNLSLTRVPGPERPPVSRQSSRRLHRLPIVTTCKRRTADSWTCR